MHEDIFRKKNLLQCDVTKFSKAYSGLYARNFSQLFCYSTKVKQTARGNIQTDLDYSIEYEDDL